MLRSHGLGDMFRLAFIFEQLIKVGLDFKDYLDKEAIGSAFFGRLVRDSMNHSLREMKFKARIPVSHSHQLVSVADEGQAYIKEGCGSRQGIHTERKIISRVCLFGGSLRSCHLTHKMILSLCVQEAASPSPPLQHRHHSTTPSPAHSRRSSKVSSSIPIPDPDPDQPGRRRQRRRTHE